MARLLRRRQDLVHARKEFYGRTSTPAALWSPWAVRPALWVAWTPRGRARCAGSSPWTSAPSLPPLLAHRQPAKTKGDEEVPPELADGRARGPAAYLWLVVALPREYRPRQPPTAAPLSNARLAARSAENRVIMTARCRTPPRGDAPRIAGPGPFGIPVRLCTAIPEGPDRLQWRPVQDVPNNQPSDHRRRGTGSRTALTRRGSIQQKRESPHAGEVPGGLPAGALRTSRPSASVMGRSQWPVCRGVDCGRGITG